MPLNKTQVSKIQKLLSTLKERKLTEKSVKPIVKFLLQTGLPLRNEAIYYIKAILPTFSFSSSQKTKLHKLLGGCACLEGGKVNLDDDEDEDEEEDTDGDIQMKRKPKPKSNKPISIGDRVLSVIRSSGAFRKKMKKFEKKLKEIDSKVETAKVYNQSATQRSEKNRTDIRTVESNIRSVQTSIHNLSEKLKTGPAGLTPAQLTHIQNQLRTNTFDISELKKKLQRGNFRSLIASTLH